MRCTRCDYTPEKGDKFCRRCGEELVEESFFVCDCGAEVRASDKYCHQCGSMFATNVCDCGFEIPANANYCPGCGAEIKKAPPEFEESYGEDLSVDSPNEDEAEESYDENLSVDSSNEDDLGLTDLSKPF